MTLAVIVNDTRLLSQHFDGGDLEEGAPDLAHSSPLITKNRVANLWLPAYEWVNPCESPKTLLRARNLEVFRLWRDL